MTVSAQEKLPARLLARAFEQATRTSQLDGWSAPATTRRVAALLADLPWPHARVADVGAGRGTLSRLLGETIERELGLAPSDHVFACDLIPASFEYGAISCAPTSPDGALPFANDTFDAVCSIEVIEHVENQFDFLRELARIAKPGALVIVTTPNVLNANSRLRSLVCGFPVLFDPLPLSAHDPRRLGGHIHPISPYFLAYAALRAGLEEPRLLHDRTKRSAVLLSLPLLPLLWLGRLAQHLRLQRKSPALLAENRDLLAAQESFSLLTSRTAILVARKPGTR